MALSIDLDSQVALVTGGSRGIGRGIVDALLHAGATVVTCGRSEATGLPDGVVHHQVDVRDPDGVQALIDAIVATHGRLDLVVNNAGGAPSVLAAEASPRFHDKILGLNLAAPLLVAQAAHRVMAAQGSGSVVNISSISAHRPAPTIAAYAAAKAGVDSLTKSLAMEWGPAGIRVNAIDVGLCRTENTEDHYGGDDRVARIERTIPLGRMADPAEVGAVVVFLASDLASYVTGATVACHGGGEPPVFLHLE